MKKQTIKNSIAYNTPKTKLLSLAQKAIAKKMNRYIYTDQDLGEDILHVGITAALYVSMKYPV